MPKWLADSCIFLLFAGDTFSEVIAMAKQGMKRPDWTHKSEKGNTPPVPEIQGKEKSGKKSANPMIAGTEKVYHTEKPI